MALIDDLRRDVLDENASLATALRRGKVVASLVGDDELGKWVDRELNGYHDAIEEIPGYRRAQIDSYGEFLSARMCFPREQIPSSAIAEIPEDWRKWTNEIKLAHGIRGLERLVDSPDSAGRLEEEWPADLANYLHGKVYVRAECRRAWKEIPRGLVVGVLEQVRNRLLDFVLELQRTYPDQLDSDEQIAEIPQDEFKSITNNIIFTGDRSIVAAGGHIEQNVEQLVPVAAGDWESLAKYLRAQGVADAETEQLHAALDNDAPTTSETGYGPRVSQWFAGMMRKATAGAWEVGARAASTILTRALDIYLWGNT